MLEKQEPRTGLDRLKRKALTSIIPNHLLVQIGVGLTKPIRGLLPENVSSQLPLAGKNLSRPKGKHPRRMLLLEGCAQSSLTPETNAAAARVLDRLGIQLLSESKAGCCGALRLHTSEREKGLRDIKQRIDTWWPLVQSGVEAIISTASGCGVTVKDYGELLRGDPEYADKAARVAELAADISEVVGNEITNAPPSRELQPNLKVAFHSPCTLQHGQKINGQVEALLEGYGFQLLPVADGHICCGSAGTYSILQPDLSERLKADKLVKLQAHSPDVIATANVGCQLHLRKDSKLPVLHWIELLDTFRHADPTF